MINLGFNSIFEQSNDILAIKHKVKNLKLFEWHKFSVTHTIG